MIDMVEGMRVFTDAPQNSTCGCKNSVSTAHVREPCDWSWLHNSSAYNTERESKHIYLGSERLVTRTNGAGTQGNTYTAQVSTYYYHSDHLGSAQLITDNEGREYERIEYTPYGEYWIEKRAPENKTLPFKFTGKERDEETGLYYYGARYLDPRTSRWLSTDPALGEYIPMAPTNDEAKKHNQNLPGMGGIYNTVNFHLYHYAGNNPVKYIDPDGKFLINNIMEGIPSAKEYIQKNKNIPIGSSVLDNAGRIGLYIKGSSPPIILEKRLNKMLATANQLKHSKNSNVLIDVTATAQKTESGNYQIDLTVNITIIDNTGNIIRNVDTTGTIAFASNTEVGVIGSGEIDQKRVNSIANNTINLVLDLPKDTKLVEDK